MKGGHKLAYVYDDGPGVWLKTYPELTTLVGKTPADPAKAIPEEKFKAKCVDLEKFKALAKEPGAIVIDIRDPDQRKEKFEVEGRSIPLDRIEPFLKSPQAKSGRILVFDMSGKRVDWLMYHLEEYGIENYLFLEGGVSKYAKK